MAIVRKRAIGAVVAIAVLLAAILTLVPGGEPEAVGAEPRVSLNFTKVKWTVAPGEKAARKAVCEEGVVDAMRWQVLKLRTAPAKLKVVTKVSNNRRAGLFVADATQFNSLLLPAVQLLGVVTCVVK
jgi:hypothetical protein